MRQRAIDRRGIVWRLSQELLGLIVICYTVSHTQDTIRIQTFGLPSNTRVNAVPYINQALQTCVGRKNVVLLFEQGRYDFWPHHCIEKNYFESNTTVNNPRRCAILIEQQQSITIDGGGSEFIFHDRMQPFTVDQSKNVTIKNVSIDWEIPLSAEAQIVEVTPGSIEISIDTKQFPYIIEKEKLVFVGEGWKSAWWGVMEFDKHTFVIAPGTGDEACLGGGWRNYTAQELRDGLIRLNFNFKRKPAVGNFLVLRHSERDHAGIFIIESSEVVLENIHMYHNAGLGVLSQYSENLTFREVHCIPNSKKRKILSGHDDGFHYSNCKGQITVEGCSFKGLMDDPINVHGTSVKIIEKVNDTTVLCQFMHHQSVGFTWARKGEQVGFIAHEQMNTVATGLVESFQANTPELFEITFQQPIPESIRKGDALENLTWTPNVLIRKSSFGSNRARGILVSTPGKVLIDDNTFASSGAAILIAGDANYWFETGAVKDVIISNNHFTESCLTSMYQFCEGIISIYPEIPRFDPAVIPYHRNIRITGNTFEAFDYPVLYAKSVDGLIFSNNRIKRSTAYQPFHARKSMLTVEGCKAVTVQGNKFEGDVLGKNIQLILTGKKDLVLDENQGIIIQQ